jgi:hypothetical protein
MGIGGSAIFFSKAAAEPGLPGIRSVPQAASDGSMSSAAMNAVSTRRTRHCAGTIWDFSARAEMMVRSAIISSSYRSKKTDQAIVVQLRVNISQYTVAAPFLRRLR